MQKCIPTVADRASSGSISWDLTTYRKDPRMVKICTGAFSREEEGGGGVVRGAGKVYDPMTGGEMLTISGPYVKTSDAVTAGSDVRRCDRRKSAPEVASCRSAPWTRGPSPASVVTGNQREPRGTSGIRGEPAVTDVRTAQRL